MNSVNRVTSYIAIASVLVLSGCVFSPDRGYGDNGSHREARDSRDGNGQSERDRRCRSDDDHRTDVCGDHH
jgi:hypothetical protein